MAEGYGKDVSPSLLGSMLLIGLQMLIALRSSFCLHLVPQIEDLSFMLDKIVDSHSLSWDTWAHVVLRGRRGLPWPWYIEKGHYSPISQWEHCFHAGTAT